MEGITMKLVFIFIFAILSASFAVAQDEGLESLTLPAEEPKAAPTKKTDTELSLPTDGATSSSVVKSGANKPGLPKDNVGAILDFEGEVIEGERRRPDLFLQISIDNIKFDSLIYNRDDFNDYLEVDRKSRTRFLKMK
jgi:hypothetical protein